MASKNKPNKAMDIQEYLSEDIMDTTFIRSFSYFLNMQLVLGSCRVHAKDRFVTPPTIWQKLYTVLLIVITVLLDYLAISYSYTCNSFNDHVHIYYMGIFRITLDFAFFVISIIHIRFLNGEANVKFYIQLQRIDRVMKFESCTLLNQMLFRFNVLSGVALKLCVALLAGLSLTRATTLSHLFFLGMMYSNMLLSLEVLYCCNITMYFNIRMEYINAILKNHICPKSIVNYASKYNFFLEKTSRYYATQYHDYNSSDVCTYLRELFDGFFKFQELYKLQVFIFVVKQLIVSVLTFQFILYSLKNNVFRFIELWSQILYPFIEIVIFLILCVQCEIFYNDVMKTKRLCIKILSIHNEGPLREKTCKMLKLIEEFPPKFSLYDMMEINGKAFFKIVRVITSIMVTQLQFAFL